jgi:hypothetical protein
VYRVRSYLKIGKRGICSVIRRCAGSGAERRDCRHFQSRLSVGTRLGAVGHESNVKETPRTKWSETRLIEVLLGLLKEQDVGLAMDKHEQKDLMWRQPPHYQKQCSAGSL